MIRIGGTWISIERREFFREGKTLLFGCRTFDMLRILVAAPNRLVVKEELINAIWPQTRVDDKNLEVQISTLRRTLNLDRNQLETVPRRRYRLSLFRLANESKPPSEDCVTVQATPNNGSDVPQENTYVDNEIVVRTALLTQLHSENRTMTGYQSAADFFANCTVGRSGPLFLDMKLSRGSGFNLQNELTRYKSLMPMLLMSDLGSLDASVFALKAFAEGMFNKPERFALTDHPTGKPSLKIAPKTLRRRLVLAPWQERKAKEILERSLNTKLFVADVAKQCAMSRSHFSRVFKQTTGMSPKDWHLDVKIKQAKTLLAAGVVPLSQVSLECGFADQSHFSRMFSKLVGSTPKRWQKSNLASETKT